jgi:hypothetical protein
VTAVDNTETVRVDTNLTDFVSAPVSAGDSIGTATLYANGAAVCSVPIVAAESADRLDFFDYLRSAVSDYVH